MSLKSLVKLMTLSLIFFSPLGCSTNGVKQQTVTLAVHYPSSGRWHSWGAQTKVAAEMAKRKFEDQLKSANLDVQVKAFEYDIDDQNKQDQMSQQMVKNSQLLAVVSYMDHNFSKHQVPLLTWNQRSEILENSPRTIFRLSLSDTIRQKIASNYFAQKLKAKNVVIILDGSPFSINYQHSLRNQLKDRDIQVVRSLVATEKDADSIEKAVSLVGKLKPDAIIHVGSGLQKAINPIGLKLKNRAIEIPIMCLVDYPPTTLPKGLEFLYIGLFDTKSGTKKDMTELIRNYYKENNEPLGGIGIYAYEASQLFFSSLLSLHKKGSKITRASVAEELRNIRFVGITGLTTYNENGDRMTGQYIISRRSGDDFRILQKGHWPPSRDEVK